MSAGITFCGFILALNIFQNTIISKYTKNRKSISGKILNFRRYFALLRPRARRQQRGDSVAIAISAYQTRIISP